MFSSIIPCFKLAGGVSFKDFEWQNQTLLWDWHLTIKQLAQAPRALCSADPFVTKKRNHGSLWEQNHQWCRDRHRHHEVPMPEGSKVELLKEVLVLTSWWKLVHRCLEISMFGVSFIWNTPCIQIFTDEDIAHWNLIFMSFLSRLAFFTKTRFETWTINISCWYFFQIQANISSICAVLFWC